MFYILAEFIFGFLFLWISIILIELFDTVYYRERVFPDSENFKLIFTHANSAKELNEFFDIFRRPGLLEDAKIAKKNLRILLKN
jgi:hypothetical protein